MGLSSGATPRLTCDRCGRPTWRLVRDADGWACPMCRHEGKHGGTARRVIAGDPSTDCATGHCECGACGEPIDPWDRFCKHCGVRLEDQ